MVPRNSAEVFRLVRHSPLPFISRPHAVFAFGSVEKQRHDIALHSGEGM